MKKWHHRASGGRTHYDDGGDVPPQPMIHQVWDTHTGNVIGNYKIRGMARAKQDALDNNYGGYRYGVRQIVPGQTDE